MYQKVKTELLDGDHLLIITDDKCLLIKTLDANRICFNNIEPDRKFNNSILDDIKKIPLVANIKNTVVKLIGIKK